MGKGAIANILFCEQSNKADAQEFQMPSRASSLITSTHNANLSMFKSIAKGDNGILVYMLITQTF